MKVLLRFVRDPAAVELAPDYSPMTPPPQSHSACEDKPSLSMNVSSKYFVESFSLGFVLFVL